MGLASVVVIFGIIYWAEALPAKIQKILWNNPQTTIFTVGLLSYLTVSLLDGLITESCNMLKWCLCARPEGVNLLTFTTLGKVGFVQILWLLFTSREKFLKCYSSPHIFWGFQRSSRYCRFLIVRLLLTALKIVLGLSLLFNMNVDTTYPRVPGSTIQIPSGDLPIDFAGYVTSPHSDDLRRLTALLWAGGQATGELDRTFPAGGFWPFLRSTL